MMGEKVIIAHRGASIAHAENTVSAFRGGHEAGADLIETDVVLSRDGVAVCLHDLWLETTTNVVQRHPDRARADGHWYAVDFDFAEIEQLVVRGRAGGARGEERIPTFGALLGLIDELNAQTGRRVGVIVEPKGAEFHIEEGWRVDDAVIEVGRACGWNDGRMIVQSFSKVSLVRMHSMADVPLVALAGKGFDLHELDQLRGVVVGIGPERSAAERDKAALVRAAHDRGLVVYPYTFRDEPEEICRFLFELGVDGVFTDDPAAGVSVARG